ncbi:S-protein homolog 74-like [Macadamia integrifolia]|uniref:S-protein homolog 74-like n=1 Tax=Macadamia integrifolia TaxID=60698 RepID=UPI001C530B6F|nr:S-protein homolog 74-like [Macadamia integrifolia]
MARFTITFAVLVLMLLSLTEWHLVSATFYKTIHVTVHNGLGGNRELGLHCKADDRAGYKGDLGEQKIPDNGDFKWSFGRTPRDKYPLYYCEMTWEKAPNQKVFATGIHIYDFHRDDPLCGKWCERTVKMDGVYAIDLEHQKTIKLYSWKLDSY